MRDSKDEEHGAADESTVKKKKKTLKPESQEPGRVLDEFAETLRQCGLCTSTRKISDGTANNNYSYLRHTQIHLGSLFAYAFE